MTQVQHGRNKTEAVSLYNKERPHSSIGNACTCSCG